MSRQSKNVKKRILAQEFTALHKKGQRGPKQTKKVSEKKDCWYKDRVAYYRRNERAAKSPKQVKSEQKG